MEEHDSRRLQRIDNSVRLIADILVTVVALGLALCVAELIDNFSYWHARAHSWPAAIAVGVIVSLGVLWGRIMIER